jgi:hypothetical protein
MNLSARWARSYCWRASVVRREGLTRLDTIGKGGGLIIGPTHHVQLDTPLEYFWAMVDSIKAQHGMRHGV